MKWGTQWADFAFENELRAINWYQALEDEGHILGVKVVVGKIRAKTLHDVILPGMVEKYSSREDDNEDDNNHNENNATPVLEVESWTAGMRACLL
jgi:hypothetical protein